MNNDELKTRREFFRKVASVALPLLSTSFVSCGVLQDSILNALGGESSSGSSYVSYDSGGYSGGGTTSGCSWGCVGVCQQTCTLNCASNCTNGCKTSCTGSCKSSCSGSCRGSSRG